MDADLALTRPSLAKSRRIIGFSIINVVEALLDAVKDDMDAGEEEVAAADPLPDTRESPVKKKMRFSAENMSDVQDLPALAMVCGVRKPDQPAWLRTEELKAAPFRVGFTYNHRSKSSL